MDPHIPLVSSNFIYYRHKHRKVEEVLIMVLGSEVLASQPLAAGFFTDR